MTDKIYPLFPKNLSGVPLLPDIPNAKGVTYRKLKKSFKIKYSVLAINMAIPLAMILLGFAIFYQLKAELVQYSLIIPMSIWLGFWTQAYNLHFHEAAHFNLHKNRLANDLLALLLLTPFVGQLVSPYRISHWAHHRQLGLIGDTEISYIKPLTARGMLEGLFGIYLIKMLLIQFKNLGARKKIKSTGKISFFLGIGIFLITNIAISFALYAYISSAAAISWALSLLAVGPFLNKLRQTLEHRSYLAERNVDYSLIEHGPINRLFGKDLFSRYFGGAGFNSHLLHHLDPSVSYTYFPEIENYLLNSAAKDLIRANRTTYLKCFNNLIIK